MPELPEVEAIVGVIKSHAVGRSIIQIDVLRGRYFDGDGSAQKMLHVDLLIRNVYRLGKWIIFLFPEKYLIAHNAMTGYFDWKHDPWTFDYVEADRDASESDVRVNMTMDDGKVLRFHDARLFGRLNFSNEDLPKVGPELLGTPNGSGRPVINYTEFALKVLNDKRSIKVVIMDQHIVAGIGNIYANEGCHLAGIDPRTPAQDVRPELIPILLESLRCAVLHSMPTVTYDWLRVYRRTACGTCAGPIKRIEIAKRATFICENCQGEP